MSLIDTALPAPRALIVEDETLVAMMIEDMLEALGYVTAFHATSVEDGLRYAQTGTFDAAILDINIIGGTSFSIAAMIEQRGIPFTFCTGYGRLGLPAEWENWRCVSKPFSLTQLATVLDEML